ncbi:MAG TPA: phosphatidylinositol-specific phospholipase C domain-containing protein [Archangium sp.]|uniref:phosphatidylinositol-specific phospholipase C domain-containing protein n=1 Tax=Archangium sp. TaxID=1872627 RepID=UPI002E363F68|nr:phosphatidylinositol-specific phospholipase C domain-containing protein [Archangium sp.]HEX5754038.1 phosphatidylinositol-specific phospholipase C domain-containing protein [Archangium sp.]
MMPLHNPSLIRRGVLALLLALLLPAPFAAAHGRYFNDATSIPTQHPNWMRWVPDSTRVSALSLPGTHDTMADETEWYVTVFERAWILTQGLNLRPQLDAGVRAVDIRARHIGDRFTIHHGAYYLMTHFDDVLATTVQFLKDNPTETVLMRVKKEHTEENTTRSFAATFEWYRDQPAYNPYIWRGTYVPTLSEVRGKIVILDDFEGGDHGINWGSIRLQDAWEETNTTNKWNLVRNHLVAANTGDLNALYVNFLSASGAGGTPAGIADDVNEQSLHYLMGANVQRTGVMMMDFPGAGLIDAIIAHNFRLATNAASLGADFTTAFNNISYGWHADGDDKARDRVIEARTFLDHKLPGMYWHVIVSGTPGGDNWGYSATHYGLYRHSDWVDGYSHVAFNTLSSDSAVSESFLASYVDGQLGSLSGTAENRAAQLASRVRARFPFQYWTVLVKRTPGGFDNWAYTWWGAHYMRWYGDYAYAVWGYGAQAGVYLYEHVGYQGDVIHLTGPTYELSSRGFNDRASSVRLIGNYRANLWQHDNWGGSGLYVTQNIDNLGTQWNDQASSLEVWRY